MNDSDDNDTLDDVSMQDDRPLRPGSISDDELEELEKKAWRLDKKTRIALSVLVVLVFAYAVMNVYFVLTEGKEDPSGIKPVPESSLEQNTTPLDIERQKSTEIYDALLAINQGGNRVSKEKATEEPKKVDDSARSDIIKEPKKVDDSERSDIIKEPKKVDDSELLDVIKEPKKVDDSEHLDVPEIPPVPSVVKDTSADVIKTPELNIVELKDK